MYCSSCGADVSGNFCSNCGTSSTNNNKQQNVDSQEDKKGFWTRLNEQAQEINQAKAQKRNYQKERLEQMDRDGIAYCPKCHSTSLSAHKKGFGIGKAIIGSVINPIGLVAGNIGAKKIRVTCLKCGKQFWAGRK